MEEVIVHQALHGYSDGHSLLATSTDLSSEEKFVLLRMSDLSGSLSGSDFEPYITAYPLSTNFYALAKTWSATEMPRPGCVWTHTILVGSATLGRIENLAELVKFFRKPSKGFTQIYQQSIRLDQVGRSQNLVHTPDFLSLLAILYGSNKAAILLSAPINIEELLFEAWSYQWPRLRRSFSFSIGSFAPRYLGNKSLDLQVMNHRDFHFGNAGRGDFVVYQSLNSVIGDINWTELVKESDMNDVLSFMYKYGSDVDSVRTKYVDLFLAYQVNNDLESLESPINVLFSFFRTHFQDRSEAKNLKRDLVLKAFENDKRNLYFFLIFANENEGNRAPFAEINWNYSAIIEELWSNQVISLFELQSLLTRINVNDLTIEFFVKLPLESWIGNGYVTGPFVNELLRLSSQIIANDTIWIQEQQTQKIFFDAFTSLSNDIIAGLFPQVIESMIRNDNDIFAKDLVSRFRSDAVVQALKASESTGRTLPVEWERLALGFFDAIINHTIEGKISNYKLTLLLKVASSISNLSDTSRIISLIEKTNKIQNGMVIRLDCIIISSCFKNQLKDSGRVFGRLFQKIHDLAKTGNLNAQDWEIVYYSLPTNRRLIPNKSKSWFFGVDEDEVPFWDRCEFMRRGMLECFVQYNWVFDHFFGSVQDNDTLKRIAKFAMKTDVGYKFMIELVSSHIGREYPDHLKTIHKTIEKRK